ncbi:uncharacterized protein TNCV_3024191 [Trichonephila clavipes]|nr:uncharacterized protein TNCV_3024191 [Trichonephila clavipes]
MGLVKEYKENEGIRNVCRMISALAYMQMAHIEDAWSIAWENAFSIDKLSLFFDCFVEQWMDSKNMSIKTGTSFCGKPSCKQMTKGVRNLWRLTIENFVMVSTNFKKISLSL